jgi:hypothetical protein
MSDELNAKYVYPVGELDKIIEQMNQGIQPMISDEMMLEVRLRIKEIENELFDEDDEDPDDADAKRRHRVMLQNQLEKEKRKATQHDVIILEISEEQKKKIREEMSVSIVRPDPNSVYNKTDEEMYANSNRREIAEKLKGLKNCYYSQKDWINAMKIIMEAIEVSLGKYGDSDYPWLSYEEAKQMFREHKIKLKYPIPKLYINHSTILADKELLKGVLTGDVVLKDKREEEAAIKKNKKKKDELEPVIVPYDIISENEYNEMLAAHRAGYETPLSALIRVQSRTYNPTALPFGNRFAISKNPTNENGVPIAFDWAREGAGEEYYKLIHGVKTDVVDLMRFLNSENDNMLNDVLSTNARAFIGSLKAGTSNNPGYNYFLPNYIQPTTNTNPNINENAAAIERELLASIQMNNPSIG